MRQIYFIVNPKAKNGYCLKIWQKIELQLKETGLCYFSFFTEYPGHAKIISSQIALNSDNEVIIIAVGGDGTLHEIMNGIVNKKNITLGIVPGGSGNDFSRGFHIPSDPSEALQFIIRLMRDESPFIDTGKIIFENEREPYFINNMGAGFDALISYEVNQSRIKGLLNKFSLGRLVYVYILLKKLFSYQCSTISIMIDGKKHIFEHTWFVTVSNQPYYGGGMKIAPSAIPDDGLLDITIVHHLSKIKLLFVFISVFFGKHIYFKEVEMFKGSEISIHSSSKLFVHADGEFVGYTPLNIQVQPSSLRVLTRKYDQKVDLWREEMG